MEKQPTDGVVRINCENHIETYQFIQAMILLGGAIYSCGEKDLAMAMVFGARHAVLEVLDYFGEAPSDASAVLDLHGIIKMAIEVDSRPKPARNAMDEIAAIVVRNIIAKTRAHISQSATDPLTAEADSAIAEALEKAKDPE